MTPACMADELIKEFVLAGIITTVTNIKVSLKHCERMQKEYMHLAKRKKITNKFSIEMFVYWGDVADHLKTKLQ